MPSTVTGQAAGSGGSLFLETPSGTIDGVNTEFVFTSPPVAVYFQGILQNESDYTLVGSTVTFDVAPVGGVVQGLMFG